MFLEVVQLLQVIAEIWLYFMFWFFCKYSQYISNTDARNYYIWRQTYYVCCDALCVNSWLLTVLVKITI